MFFLHLPLNQYNPFHRLPSQPPFLTPMPAISHFALLILSPEKRENLSNVLITSVADFSFLRKKVVSSA